MRSLLFVALLIGVVSAQHYNGVQYHDNVAEPRFQETGVRLVHPTVEYPHTDGLLHTSVPEPASAQEPKKSLVEEVTGVKDADEMRFQQVQAAANKNAQYSTVEDTDSTRVRELKGALQNVKDQIVGKASSIKTEKQWVKDVTKIIESYVHKTRRVNADIRKQQKQVKDLFRKKKQIENLILQNKLMAKLKVANKDLGTLKAALHTVQHKEKAFTRSKKDITETIGAIEAELKALKGGAAAKPAGSSASSSASS